MFVSGKLNLWSMAKMFEAIRYTVFENGFAYLDRLRDKEHSVFMAGTSYHATDNVNMLTSHTLWGYNFPLYVRMFINYVGTSSISFKINLSNRNTSDVLFTAFMTFVYVEFLTRKPCPFPGWFNQAKKSQRFDSPQPRLPVPAMPSAAFMFETQSVFSDIDHNGHVNQSVNVRWCTDAGTEAAQRGHYKGFKNNIGSYPLEKLEIKYAQEGMVHEQFVICTWQDTTNPLVLHFIMTKSQKPCVFVMIQFKSFTSKARL